MDVNQSNTSHTKKKKKIVMLFILMLVIAMSFMAGALVGERYAPSERGITALVAQAIDQADAVSSAQSTLNALSRGDTEVATLTLQSQLQQGLVILNAIYPRLAAENALKPKDRQMIDEVIKDGEGYARDHKLQINLTHFGNQRNSH